MDKIYKALYLLLFNRISDAIQALDVKNYAKAREILLNAQCTAEEMFISEK